MHVVMLTYGALMRYDREINFDFPTKELPQIVIDPFWRESLTVRKRQVRDRGGAQKKKKRVCGVHFIKSATISFAKTGIASFVIDSRSVTGWQMWLAEKGTQEKQAYYGGSL
jgi:hypothetical protein